MTTENDDNTQEVRSTASAGYALHVDGDGPIDPATQAAIDKMAALLRAKELIRTGNAAVDKTGRVVDRRAHPDAVPIPAHNDPSSATASAARPERKGDDE